MGVDLDVIAVGRDRGRRAYVDALVAADLAGAAVRAYLLVISEEPRFLELADHLRKLRRRERLLERIITGREIALRRLRRPDERFAGKIEHHVEALNPLAVGALEVERTDSFASFRAIAVTLSISLYDF